MSYEQIWLEARQEAERAFIEAKPTPVAFQNSGLGEKFDWNKPYDIVEDGVCGYAWVWLPSARDPFVKWLKQNNMGRKSYGTGYDIWSSYLVKENTQSMQRKEAAVEAAVKVLRANGIEAYSQSRMD